MTLMGRRLQPGRISPANRLTAVLRPRSGIGRGAWRILQAASWTAGALLVAFHAWLLWDRLAAGEFFDPVVALRWGTCAITVAAFVALHRAGASMFHGRRALVVWLLVALIHVGNNRVVNGAIGPASGDDAAVTFVLPSVVAVGLSGVALLCLLSLTRRRTAADHSRFCTVELEADGRPSRGWRRPGPSRAPPLAFA